MGKHSQPLPEPYRPEIAAMMKEAKTIRDLRILMWNYAQGVTDRKESRKLAEEMLSAVWVWEAKK